MIFREGFWDQPARHLPTAGTLDHSFELMLMNYAGVVKVNLERQEVYAQVNFKDGSSRLYTMPITDMFDDAGEEVDDPSCAVQVLVGGTPLSSNFHSTTRYGTAVLNVVKRVQH